MHTPTKKVLSYVLLPQVTPRLQNLLGGGFGFFALMMAQIFSSIKLLPASHPYLSASNTGRYSIRHVIYEAWRHLKFDHRHLDQVLMFGVIVTGLFILVLQVALLMLGVFSMGSAMALNLPAYFDTMLITQNPENDIAFIMLDRVFGIPDLFNSCVAQAAPCFANTQYNPQNIVVDPVFPGPFHLALHQFLSVYSYALLVVAAIIILYLVISIIGETAQTGTPFGRRFNHVWAPLRLVIALGLLIPLQSGLNSGQYIVLYAAKFGSGFATNGWNIFLDGAGLPGNITILGDPQTLVGLPESPPVSSLLQFGTSLAACIRTQQFFYQRTIQGFLVNPTGMTAATSRINLDTLPTYDQALTFTNYGDIYFVFGAYEVDNANQPIHTSYPGSIKPYCGEIVMQITDVADAYSPGSRTILEEYYFIITELLWPESVTNGPMWGGLSFGQVGDRAARKHIAGYLGHDTELEIATSEELIPVGADYENVIDGIILDGVTAQRNAPSWTELDDFGWAGAGIWYNKVAELNGMMVGAAGTLPNVRAYPLVMEKVRKERAKYDQDSSGPEQFLPRRADGTEIKLKDDAEYKEAEVLYAAFKVWGDKMSPAKPTANALADAIHAIFGTKGLYNMSRNTDIHPLAQLVGVGKTLIESAIRNLGASAFAGIGGGLLNLLSFHPAAGNFASMASSLAGKIALFGMTAGFLLFYLVPFLPFMYYFFALGMWVKTVMEAMVGTPLWALAHLRIDGDGLPGQAAVTGYVMILEVFLRPICTVFGLLASVVIFGAQVKILHEIWPLVTSNLTGFDTDLAAPPAPDTLGGLNYFRGLIDQFMFTVMYTFVVYMMALSSFKLIDAVPDHILRWMGSGAQSFGGIAKDDVAGTPTRAVVAVGMGLQQAMSAGKGVTNVAAQLNQHPKAK